MTLKCPGCEVAPEPKLINGLWEVRCERHGHVANGQDETQAILHWNKYIWFVRTGEVRDEPPTDQ